MEKIEGIELAKLVSEAEEQILKETEGKLRHKIQSIIGEKSKAAGTITRIKQDLVKAESSLKRYEDQLAGLRQNKWELLKEEKSGEAATSQGSKPDTE